MSCYHRPTVHSARLTAFMDAHGKAETLHRDISLGNIILYRPRKEVERLGYLVDWELTCKLSEVTARGHLLIVRPDKVDPK